MNFSIEPDTIQGVLTIITAVGVAAGLVATAVVKVLTPIKEIVAELKGIRTDQAAADVLKVKIGQATLQATPGAEPITIDAVSDIFNSAVKNATVNLLKRAAPSDQAATASEDLGAKTDRLIEATEKLTEIMGRIYPATGEAV